MVVMVFGNVVLRYAFNSGITVSEELSRWLFVWLTFLGAIVAIKEHGHLGTDMLVGAPVGARARRPAWSIGHLLMLYVHLAAVLRAAWRRRASTGTSRRRSPAPRWPSSMPRACSSPSPPRCCCCASCGAPLTGRIADDELVMVQESEDLAHVQTAQRRHPDRQALSEEPHMTVLIFLGSLLGAMALGMPIAFSLLLSGVALMWHLDLFDAQILAQNLIDGADSFPLLAVPFFMLAGEIMNVGGLCSASSTWR